MNKILTCIFLFSVLLYANSDSTASENHSTASASTAESHSTASAPTAESHSTATASTAESHSTATASTAENHSTATAPTAESHSTATASTAESHSTATASTAESHSTATASTAESHSTATAPTAESHSTATAPTAESHSTATAPTTESHSSSSTILSTTVTTSGPEIDYCTTDPNKECNLQGPIRCSKNNDGYNCSCDRGYYHGMNNTICLVASSTEGYLTLYNYTHIQNDTLYQDIMDQIDEANANVPTYISCIVTPKLTNDDENIFADDANVILTVKIFLSGINKTDVDEINQTIQNLVTSCSKDSNCFGTTSGATFDLSNSIDGPCETTPKLCDNYPGTLCVDVETPKPDVQFQCQCPPNRYPKSSYKANEGEIFVCDYGEPEDHCGTNTCKNGGTCHPTLDGFYCTCPWTYIGDRCTNGLPLAMVIVSCILGALTLILIGVLIYSHIKSKKVIYSSPTNDNAWISGSPHRSKGGKVDDAYEPSPGRYENKTDHF